MGSGVKNIECEDYGGWSVRLIVYNVECEDSGVWSVGFRV